MIKPLEVAMILLTAFWAVILVSVTACWWYDIPLGGFLTLMIALDSLMSLSIVFSLSKDKSCSK